MGRMSDMARLRKQIALTLMAGAVSIVPSVAYGMPTGANVLAGGGGAGITKPDAQTMQIAMNAQNNVISWQDFSIAENEKVKFTNNKNYLNIVRGAGTSFIDGTLNGGGGCIALVNPHGVIFGSGAKVDVGAGQLLVSTQPIAPNSVTSWDGTSSALIGAGQSDIVVNLGSGNLVANKVEMVGRNIRFVNVDAAAGASSVILQADTTRAGDGYGTVHIGYDANPSGDTFPEGSVDVAKASTLMTHGWRVNGATDATSLQKALYRHVENVTQLQNIQNNPSANYMLVTDLVSTGSDALSNFTPIANFTGNFDGAYHTITGLTVPEKAANVGLFANVIGNGADKGNIANVGLIDAFISTNKNSSYYAGSFAGTASNAVFQNVYTKNTHESVDPNNMGVVASPNNAGGLIGHASATTIRRSYNAAPVFDKGGALVGDFCNGGLIEDVYNEYVNTFSPPMLVYGLFAKHSTGTTGTIKRAYSLEVNGWASTTAINVFPGLEAGSAYDNTSTTHIHTVQTGVPEDFSDWGSAISKEGGSTAVWRLQKGTNRPILADFYQGTVAVSFEYAMGVDSYAGQSGANYKIDDAGWQTYTTPTPTYNGQELKLTNVTYSNGTGADITYYDGSNAGASAYNTGIKNADSYTLFSSDRYDLVGGDFMIKKRKLLGTTGAQLDSYAMEYNGTANLPGGGSASVVLQATEGITGVVATDADKITVGGNINGTFYKSKAEYDVAADKATVESKDVGKGKYVRLNFSGVTISKADGVAEDVTQNYEIGSITTSGTLESENGMITPRNIVVKAENVSKVYDGTKEIQDPYSYLDIDESVIVAGDGISVAKDSETGQYTVTGTYSDANAGTNKDVKYTGLMLTGGENLVNYRLVDEHYNVLYYNNCKADAYDPAKDFANVDNGVLYGLGTIERRKLDTTAFTVAGAATSVIKEYDNTATATLADGTYLTQVEDTEAGTGIIDADIAKIKFVTSNGKYVNGSGTETVHATDNGGAQKARFTIRAQAVGVNDVLNNYEYYDPENPTDPALLGKSIGEDGVQAAVEVDGKITKRKLLATATTIDLDKVYDGNANIEKTGDMIVLLQHRKADGTSEAGIISEDGTINSSTAAYVDKNVKRDSARNVIAKDITITLKLDGTNKDDYEIVDVSGATVDTLMRKGAINPVALVVSVDAPSKTFDDSADVLGKQENDKLHPVATGLVGGDTFNPAAVKGQYGVLSAATFTANKNAGDKTVLVTNIAAALGTNYDNYNVEGETNYIANGTSVRGITTTGTIFKRAINAGDIKTNFTFLKEYDGTADAKNAITGESVYIETTDVDSGKMAVPFRVESAAYANVDAGENKQVHYAVRINDLTNFEVTGSLTGEYSGTVNTGKITPRLIKATIASGANLEKEYDGTANVNSGVANLITWQHVDASGNAIAGDALIGSDGVTTSESAAKYTIARGSDTADANVARDASGNVTGKNVRITAALLGDKKTNYEIVGSTTVDMDGKITPKAVKVGFSDVEKVYDGNSNVTDPTLCQTQDILSQRVTGDSAELSIASGFTGQYRSSHVRDNRDGSVDNVTYSGLKLTGENANNYKLVDLRGNDLEMVWDAGESKPVYTGKGNGTIIQRIIDISSPIKWKWIQEGSADKAITKVYDGDTSLSGYTESGTQVDAYTYLESLTYDITPSETITLWDANSRENADISAEYAQKNVGADIGVTYHAKFKNTTSAADPNADYKINLHGSTDVTNNERKGAISQRTLIVDATDTPTKTYDATTNVVVDGDLSTLVAYANKTNTTGIISGDAVKVDVENAVYDHKNAGDREVTYTVRLDGAAAANYKMKHGSSDVLDHGTFIGRGKIEKAELTVSFDAVQKEYDGRYDLTNTSGDTVSVSVVDGLVDDDATNTALQNAYQAAATGGITGTYGKTNESGGFEENADAADKAMRYTNVNGTWTVLTTEGAQNYRIAKVKIDDGHVEDILSDTVYFKEAAAKGKITPLAITAASLTRNWNDVTKEYDGTPDAAKDLLTLHYNVTNANGRTVDGDVHFDVTNAEYGDVAGSAWAPNPNVGVQSVRYSLTIKDDPNILLKDAGGNPVTTLDETLTNGVDGKTVAITPRVISAPTVPIVKVYDGTVDIDAAGHEALENAFGAQKVTKQDGTTILKPDGTPMTIAELLTKAHATLTVSDGKYADANASVGADVASEDAPLTKGVSYTATLSGAGSGNFVMKRNADRDVITADGKVAKYDYYNTGDIKKRVVYVEAFGTPEKEYNGDRKSDFATWSHVQPSTDTTGIIDGATLTGDATYAYKDVQYADGEVTTQAVTLQNLAVKDNVSGNVSDNYEVRTTGVGASEDKKSITVQGKITPVKFIIRMVSDDIVKEYDGTSTVADPALKYEASIPTVTNSDGAVITETVINEVKALYTDRDEVESKNVADALGVTYTLKYNRNYELVKVYKRTDATDASGILTRSRIEGTGDRYAEFTATGHIMPKEITMRSGSVSVDKEYDGTPNVTDTALTIGLLDGVLAGEEDMLGIVREGELLYRDAFGNAVADTGAADDAIEGAVRTLNGVRFAISNTNYTLVGKDAAGYITWTGGTGKINRKKITVTPHDITTYGTAPTFTGTTGTYVTNAAPQSDVPHIRFGVEDAAATTEHWTREGTYAIKVFYNNMPMESGQNYYYNGSDALGNRNSYYYVSQPGTLTIRRSADPTPGPVDPFVPFDPSNPSEAREVVEAYLDLWPARASELDFRPDDRVYTYASRDTDKEHFYRKSNASISYTSVGVNLHLPKASIESAVQASTTLASAMPANANATNAVTAPHENATELPALALATTIAKEAIEMANVASMAPLQESDVQKVAMKPRQVNVPQFAAPARTSSKQEKPSTLRGGIRVRVQREEVDEDTLMEARPDRDRLIGIETRGSVLNMTGI